MHAHKTISVLQAHKQERHIDMRGGKRVGYKNEKIDTPSHIQERSLAETSEGAMQGRSHMINSTLGQNVLMGGA